MVARGRDEERQPPTSASRLLAQTPSSVPPPLSGGASSSPSSDEYPPAVSMEVPTGALAATVAEWMPVGATRSERRGFHGPVSGNGAGDRTPSDPLAAVGLHEGAIVDRTYRVERALGVGGMGSVALATDVRLDRKVAIKFIKPELFAFPEMRTFFHNEARAMARVGHRNVLSVFAFGEHEGTPYFVMEYVDGKTVDQWLRQRPAGAFPDLDEAVSILEQSCLGVEAIHATSTVHRDLKPSNLLIDQSFRVAVGDLGVARVARHRDQRQLHRRQRVVHGSRGCARRGRSA